MKADPNSPAQAADALVEALGYDDAVDAVNGTVEWTRINRPEREQHWRDVAALLRLMKVDDTTESAPE